MGQKQNKTTKPVSRLVLLSAVPARQQIKFSKLSAIKTVHQEPHSMEEFSNQDFAGIYSEHCDRIVRNLVRYNNAMEEDAEDAFMDAIVVLIDKVAEDSFINDNVGGFLEITAKNKLRNTQKKNKRQAYLEEWMIDLFLETGDCSELSEEQERRIRCINKAVKALPKKLGKVMKMVLLERASHNQVKDELGYPDTDTVKTLVYRGKNKIRKAVKKMMSKITGCE